MGVGLHGRGESSTPGTAPVPWPPGGAPLTETAQEPAPAAAPRRAGALPPGPSWWWVLTHLRDLLGRPLPHWRRFQRDYGDVVRIWLGPETLTLLAHPDHVQRVLQTRQRQYVRAGYGYDVLRLVQGQGLLTSDGELWRTQRRRMQPVFHKSHLDRLLPTVTRLTRRMLERWESRCDAREPIDIYSEMIRLAVEIMGEGLASLDMRGRLEELEPAREVCNHEVTRRMTDPLAPPLWLPTASNRAFRGALETFDRMAQEMIDERRREPVDQRPHDFLTLMLAARDEDSGEGMDDGLLRDEIVTLAGAGNETSGLSLTWLFYQLARNPAARDRLYQEAAALPTDEPGLGELPHLEYTLQAFEEALRMYPPIYAIPRQATEDDEVDGYRIPAGSTVLVSQYVTQRHPDFWDEPDAFRPERFAPEAVEARHRFAHFPFGGGAHVCIGQQMARMDAQVIVGMIARRFRLEPVEDEPVGIRAGITIRPDRRVLMRLERT